MPSPETAPAVVILLVDFRVTRGKANVSTIVESSVRDVLDPIVVAWLYVCRKGHPLPAFDVSYFGQPASGIVTRWKIVSKVRLTRHMMRLALAAWKSYYYRGRVERTMSRSVKWTHCVFQHSRRLIQADHGGQR